MRCLVRNKTKFYYRLYEGMREELDEDGNISETNVPVYSEPIEMMANVSVASGQRFVQSVSVHSFGLEIDYDKVIVTDEMDCPIDEATVLYVDRSPWGENGELVGFDYRVTRVSRSMNNITYQIKKVNVS